MLKRSLPDLLRTVREDTEREVAMIALQAVHDVLEKVDGNLLLNSVPELVMQTLTCVKDVFSNKVLLHASWMGSPANHPGAATVHPLDYVTSVDLWSDIIAMEHPSQHILRLLKLFFFINKKTVNIECLTSCCVENV